MAANVQSMCQNWKNFDLQELQRELDTTATELANRQDESDESRKRLVELSRDFKRNNSEDIYKIAAPLLKSFQLEVDSLSKRSKAAEAAFLAVYKKLIDLPDPVSTLELIQNLQKDAHRAQALEAENKQLTDTLDKCNHELAEVKSQAVTTRDLQEEAKEHEDRSQSCTQIQTTEKEQAHQRTFTKKEGQLDEIRLIFDKDLEEAQLQIVSIRADLEAARSELLEVKCKHGQDLSVKSKEMEMVKADLEHANERAASAERQAERLKHQLALATESLNLRSEQSPDRAMDFIKRSNLEVELAAKEKEVARLMKDVQRLNTIRETTLAQMSKLEAELSAKNHAFRVLEEKLRTQDSYEDVIKELRVLKSKEFANAYNEDGPCEERRPLEMVPLERKQTLQADSPKLRIVNSYLPYSSSGNTTTFHTTTSSSTKKSERSPSPLPSSSSLPGPPFSPSSTTISAAVVSPAPAFHRSSSVSSAKLTAEVTTTSRPALTMALSSSPAISAATSTIKQEVPSPVSTTPHPTSLLATSSSEAFTNSAISDFHRGISTPSSGRYSPATNCKLSPDIPTPSQTPHSNSGPTQSPITALHSHIDPRHFAPPMSPFYGFPSSPFHPAYFPLNMVKSEVNSSGSLDTSYVAKTVRELLSIHNIGQRLFAKHVLGLSQGTVSELLSKPKSWDKLTEKGRESYRKMHAWATDDSNIMALKAISPKKGTQPITSNNSYKEKEDSATEERIANILNEAQVAMHMKKSLEQAVMQQQVANAVVSSIYHHELSKLGGAPPGMAMMSPTMPPTSLSNGPHYPREGSRKMRDNDSRHHSSSSSQDEMASAQEMVARIYKQELLKLKKAADAAGNIAASTMYAQELDRLNKPQNAAAMSISSSSSRHRHSSSSSTPPADSPEPSPLALDCRSTHSNGLNLKTEPPDSTSDDTASQINNCGAIDLSKPSSHASSTPSSSPTSESGRHAGSAFFLVRPRMNGHDTGATESPLTPTQLQQGTPGGPRYGSVPPAECLSPLQRMQNIANSLTSRPNVGMPNAKPLRAVLPPITQEEFDRYANMNTDDLVKKVKETLSQYSISQRLFGESILGLSQGSVSDLLARPKPWHMLTQKGREPFIRMQIFLEDPDSIPKLVASQYRIPPDKLMRSNSRGSNEPESPCDLPAHSRSQGSSLPSQPHSAPPLPPPPPPLLVSHPPPLSLTSPLPSTPPNSPPSSLISPSPLSLSLSTSKYTRPSLPPPPPPISLPQSPILPSPTTPTSLGARLGPPSHIPPSLPHGIGPSGMPLTEHFLGTADHAALQRVWGTFAYPSSLLEVIAMTSEIDTLSLTSRVKDVLQFHNLGQKLFGEAVLGLSQGSVSELLSKPKPWHMLSIKGREPFIKMHLWLGDPQNVEHLKLYQTQMKAYRRRKSSMDDRSFDSPTQPKRPRVFFTEDQKDSLRQAYAQDPYPNQSTIEALAKSLNVGVKTVINWFHNHRMRAKQQHHAGGDMTVKSELDESSNQSDISSMSGDVTSAMSGGQFFNGGITPTDVNQWMFPRFEAISFLHKVPSPSEENGEDNKENNGGLEEDEDDEMDEPDGLDSSTLNNNNKEKDNEDDVENASRNHDDDDDGRNDRDDRIEDSQRLIKSGEDGFSENRGSITLTSSNSSGVNKRKRSNPQRVYEGAQLDRTINVTADSVEGDDIVDDKSETLEDSQEDHPINCSNSITTGSTTKYNLQGEINGDPFITDSESSPIDNENFSLKGPNCSMSSTMSSEHEAHTVHRIQKIEKIQKAIKSAVEHWDEDERSPSLSIEKIQKHLEKKSTDKDWEF